jgi:hypothetical protein
MNSTGLNRAFLRADADYAWLGVLEETPRCWDCEKSGKLKHFDSRFLVVSTQGANGGPSSLKGELGKIQEQVKWEYGVDGKNGFMRYLECAGAALSQYPRPGKMLDLIDHSTSEQTLRLGNLRNAVQMSKEYLDANVDLKDALSAFVVNAKICGIRLIGCRTGCGRAHANLADLHAMFRVPVWGTRRVISHEDFDDFGILPALYDEVFTSSATARVECDEM